MRWLIFSLFIMSPFVGTNGTRMIPELSLKQLHGVDVSHHQKDIEWETVAAQDEVDFAFVKATEGADFTDTLFNQNWEDLKRLGIQRGAYHFFRAYGCGYEQAQHFLATVQMCPGDFVPVLDVETLDGVSPEVLREEMLVWLQTVENTLQVKPIIYTNQNFYERFLADGTFDGNPLWIARYSSDCPDLADGRLCAIWQRSNTGCVEGISCRVDLNVFAGDEQMLDRLCWYPPASIDTEP